MKEDKGQRESFVAYRSFEKKKLPDSLRLKYYDALFAYGLRQEVPDFQGDYVLESIWDSVTPQIDANLQRYFNGTKGGCPKGTIKPSMSGNQNARKKQNRNKTESKPNENDNKNKNVTDNDNVTLFDGAEGDASASKDVLSFPFSSKKFADTWKELCRQPKWKKKSIDALQKSLNKIAVYPEKYAIELMEDAIANDYQGLVFASTPANFERWKKCPSQQFPQPSSKVQKIVDERNKFQERLHEIFNNIPAGGDHPDEQILE